MFKRIFIILTAAFLCAPSALAWEVNSRYFTVNIHRDINGHNLLEKLPINHLLHPEILAAQPKSDANSTLAATLDALYLEVSDILDIHLYDLRVNLEIVPNRRHLTKLIESYLGSKVNISSFYLHDKKTVYISAADITTGMLGHELAHAIISHYFVVPPPHKVQEVLCGYVEYSLRKQTGQE